MSTSSHSVTDEQLRFPIGKFRPPQDTSETARRSWLESIEQLPVQLRAAVEGLSDAQLDTPYRPGGWTVRQLVHHIADSHINSYVRLRLALTEDTPLIKTYDEKVWATLPDARTAPADLSLMMLEGLHARWTRLLHSFTEADWNRTLRHPDLGELPLTTVTALYAWHSLHHVAHITGLRERTGW